MLNSPWELILTEPVPEVVEFHSADWAELPNQRGALAGNSVAFLREAVFFIDRPSCLARTAGRLSSIFIANVRDFYTVAFACGESQSSTQGYFLFLLDRLITFEALHDVQIAFARATQPCLPNRTWEQSANYSACTFSCSCYRAKRKCIVSSSSVRWIPNVITFVCFHLHNQP